MKKIIVGGCSFTDKNMPKRAVPNPMDFKMWPEILGEITNYEIINTARCGAGNKKIFSDVTNEIVKHEPKDIAYVIVAWSEWTRQDILSDNTPFTDSAWRTIVPHISDERDKILEEKKLETRFFPHHEENVDKIYSGIQAKYPRDKDIISEQLQTMFHFQSLCEYLNIDYRQMQMLSPFPWWRKKELYDNYHDSIIKYDQTKEEKRTNQEHQKKTRTLLLMNNPITTILDDSKFIGFPIFDRIGGHTILDIITRKYGRTGYRINDIDAHPNEQCQRFIAEVVSKTLDL